MELLKERIRKEGKILPGNIVKVDGFLNHRIDVPLMEQIAQEFRRVFAGKDITLVLTAEASGIALALAAAHFLDDIPVVFAKKRPAANQSADMLTAVAHSFTHGNDNALRVDRRYLPAGSRVLVVDDFLADGEASRALISIVEQAGCTLVGVGIAVEKGFQPGGRKLREAGVNLKSLAIVTSIQDGRIQLADDD